MNEGDQISRSFHFATITNLDFVYFNNKLRMGRKIIMMWSSSLSIFHKNLKIRKKIWKFIFLVIFYDGVFLINKFWGKVLTRMGRIWLFLKICKRQGRNRCKMTYKRCGKNFSPSTQFFKLAKLISNWKNFNKSIKNSFLNSSEK